MPINAPFHVCPGCGARWESCVVFLADKQVVLCGYQPDYTDTEKGLILFTHGVPRCQTTFAVPVGAFLHLVERPLLSAPRLRGTEYCHGHCERANDLEPCAAMCECAFVRKLLQY